MWVIGILVVAVSFILTLILCFKRDKDPRDIDSIPPKDNFWSIFVLALIACVFMSGCTLFGSGTKPSEIKKACKEAASEALNETKLNAEITLYMDGSPVTGTAIGALSNDYKPSNPIGNGSPDGGSMILKLLNLTWIFLIIQVFITWGISILLKLKGIPVKLLNVSILVNLSVIFISLLLTLWLKWINIHWIDVAGTQVAGWGIQALLYDSVVKKLITKKAE